MAPRGAGTPERTCVACRRVRPKAELVRLAKLDDGSVTVDLLGTMPGRGAYVCPDRACTDRATRRLVGALRASRIDVEQVRKDLSTVGVG